jgi:hypothetical protein
MPDDTRHTRAPRGAGAAHIGFWMRGVKAPLLAPEGDGTNAGSSGAPAPQPAAPAPQPAPSAITPELQAVIQAEAKKAHDAAFAEARRMFEGKSKGHSPQPKPDAKPADPVDARDLIAMRDSFDDATADLKLTKGQRQILRDSFMGARPQDADGFVREFATRAGWVTEQPTVPADPTKTPALTPAAPAAPASSRPLSDQGSPAGAPAERAADVLKWTQADVERHYQSKGGQVRRGVEGDLDVNDARNGKIHRELRQMARSRLANVRVLLGPRRPQ